MHDIILLIFGMVCFTTLLKIIDKVLPSRKALLEDKDEELKEYRSIDDLERRLAELDEGVEFHKQLKRGKRP